MDRPFFLVKNIQLFSQPADIKSVHRSAHPHSIGVVLTRRNRPYLFFSPLISAVEKSKENIEITYVLIPTPNRKVVEKYGLRYDSFGGVYATFIVDTKGHVRFKRV